MNRTALLALALAGFATAAFAEPPAMTASSSAGEILVDAAGFSLYVFDKDTDGASACYDACATNWPPLAAAEGAMAEGDFATAARTDGTMQWTYKGQPLYTWIKDTAPGDVTGDGFNEVWHLARP